MKKGRPSASNRLARECMVTALMQLLENRPLSTITVSELTAKAGVSRMTFYRNYSSKEDIFARHLQDILEEYRAESVYLHIGERAYSFPHMLHCFQYFNAHRDFLNCLFQSGLSGLFLSALEDYVLSRWQTDPDDPAQYYALRAFSGALFSVYIAWSNRGAKETPEEMAAMLNRYWTRPDDHLSKSDRQP